MSRRFFVVALIGLAVTSLAIPIAGSHGAPDERYLLLATRRTETLEAELNEAGAAGYRVLSAWGGGTQGEVVALLEQDGRAREFRVLDGVDAVALSEVAAQGFRVVEEGLFRNRRTAIVERTPGQVDPREYRLVDSVTTYGWDRGDARYIRNLGALEEELAWMPQDGYRLVGMFGGYYGEGQVHHLLIEEMITDTGNGRSQEAIDGSGPYRLISGRPGADLQQQIDQAAAAGYRLRSGFAVRLPTPEHLTLIMERHDDAAGPYEYLLLGSGYCCLDNQVVAAGLRGYRPHPQGLFGVPDIVLMERSPDDRAAYELRWVQTTGTGSFHSDVAALAAQGYDLVAANDWEELVYHGEWNWSRNSSSHRGLMVREIAPPDALTSSSGGASVAERVTLAIPAKDKAGKIEDQLNEVASGGYCLLNVAAFHDGNAYADELGLTLERRDGSPGCEYRVFSTKRVSSMEKDFNKAAAEGFRLVGGGVFGKPAFLGTREYAAVMERTPESAANPVEYRLLATQRFSTLLEEIAEVEREGYRLRARARINENIAYMERPVREGGQ